jgi:ArsR family transcriptional regulator
MSNYRIGQLDRLADRFRALGNPGRLSLFLRLAGCCRGASAAACCDPAAMRRCVGELAAGLDLAPSTISHHLKELRRAGLVRCERRGRQIDCWVDPEVVDEIGSWLDHTLEPEGDRT